MLLREKIVTYFQPISVLKHHFWCPVLGSHTRLHLFLLVKTHATVQPWITVAISEVRVNATWLIPASVEGLPLSGTERWSRGQRAALCPCEWPFKLKTGNEGYLWRCLGLCQNRTIILEGASHMLTPLLRGNRCSVILLSACLSCCPATNQKALRGCWNTTSDGHCKLQAIPFLFQHT